MSKISRKTTLALAVAAAFAVGTPAMAASVNNGTPPNAYAYNVADVDLAAANTLPLASDLGISIATSDQIIGRTTGFAVKITLPTGVKWGAVNPTVTNGSALVGGWTSAVASGTGAGQNVIVITFSPNTAASTVGAGQLVDLTAMTLTGVSGSVNAAIQVYDPVTTANILNPLSVNLVNSVNALQYTVDTNVWPVQYQRIDVGSANFPSRTMFAEFGSVNSNDDVPWFDAGQVVITNPPGAPIAPVFNGAAGGFQWGTDSFSTGDTADLALTGNFSTFAATGGAIFLGTSPTCASTVPVGAPTATINAAGTSADFGALPFASVASHYICFLAPGGTVTINPTTIGTTLTATRTQTGNSDSGSANAFAMQYNGPVQTAFTFNPATNTNQESFLRISNTSGAAGQISITAVDDTGHKAGPVTFTLGAAQSIQLSSSDLENGNAAKGLTGSLGHGTGKWIVTVVGQVGSMEVTNLNRNNGSGTLNNLGTPVTGHGMEQYTQDVVPTGH
ncbi:MAG: hypothetical protein OJF55_001909 [Rhodanobacteraceae bacterium]|jgi:hypothetical protein|nr:MAG: hypothetical protein OJF55_001909 [Rhodanobacteraceae bacterium]